MSTDPLFHIQPTSYGGRGIFATQRTPQGTLIHTCHEPYASIIYRDFRKEVCGNCFKYAFDEGRNTWNVRLDAQPGSGVWFCGIGCRDSWQREQNVDGLLGLMSVTIDRTFQRMKDPRRVGVVATQSTPLRSEDINAEALDL